MPPKYSRIIVCEILMIYKKDGTLIDYKAPGQRSGKDRDILSGNLTAGKEFIQDMWKTVRGFKMKELEVIIEEGEMVVIVVVLKGDEMEEIRESMKGCIKRTESKFRDVLVDWSGDIGDMNGIEEIIDDLGDVMYDLIQNKAGNEEKMKRINKDKIRKKESMDIMYRGED